VPDLLYAQVVKKRRGRRLVSVSKRMVFGSLTRINEKLQAHGWGINTAFVERLNLTIRQLVPGLGRRVGRVQSNCGKIKKGRFRENREKKEGFWSQHGRGYRFLAATSGGFGAEVGPIRP
jgi:hypothetical protein